MRKLILFFSMTLAAHGAIALDATSNANLIGTCSGGACTVSWSHTVGTCANRALFVTYSNSGPAAATTMKLDNSENFVIGPGFGLTQIYKFVNPPAGVHTITTTFPNLTNGFDSVIVTGISFCGVNQDNPLTTLGPNSSSVNTPATSITTTTANDWLLSIWTDGNALSSAVAAPFTKYNSVTHASNYWAVSAAYAGPVSAGSNTVTWTKFQDGGWNLLVAIQPAQNYPTISSGGAITRPFIATPYSPATQNQLPVPRPAATASASIAAITVDTFFGTWVGAGTRAGNFGGGTIIGSGDDGNAPGCTGKNICMWEMLTFDPVTPSNSTFGSINNMSSYGGNSGLNCGPNAAWEMKSRKPFALPGLLFLPIFCMNTAASFAGEQSGFVVSPDGGFHFCNLKTFNAHSGSPGCDSSNWQAAGDNPVDNAGFQWPTTVTNKFTRMQLVDFLCQDNTVNCPAAAGVDNSYLYFMATDTPGTSAYIGRVLKSLGIQIMLPSNWTYYNAGSWDPNLANATAIGNGPLCCGSVAYLKDFAKFAIFPHAYATSVIPTADTPWGTWTTGALSADTLGFPTPVAGICPVYSGGRVTCGFWNTTNGGGALQVRQEDVGAARAASVSGGGQ